MARIRSVHPAICEDETLADVSAEAERTFVRLWTHLDDEGRCLDNARLIRAALYPLHDLTDGDVEADLEELASAGLLIRYEAAGRCYLSAKPGSWVEWQKPRHKYPSKHPDPELSTVRTYVRRASDGRRLEGSGGERSVEKKGAPLSTDELLEEACGLLADKHLAWNPSRGNPDRHRAAVVRGKVTDYRSKAAAWHEQNPTGTADELAEHLEPTLTRTRTTDAFEAANAAAQAIMDRNDKRNEGECCERCDGTGWLLDNDGAAPCECMEVRK